MSDFVVHLRTSASLDVCYSTFVYTEEQPFIVYRKSGNFRYIKFSSEKFSLYKIFVGKIFVLKNFRRVDVLRKYFNTKILQHKSREEHTESVTVLQKFFERNCIRGYHGSRVCNYIRKYGRRRLERRWCVKESPKTLPIAVKNEGTIIEHLPRKLSWECSLFLRQGSTQSQVWASSAST